MFSVPIGLRRRLAGPYRFSPLMIAIAVIGGPAYAAPHVILDFRPVRPAIEPPIVADAVTVTAIGQIGPGHTGELKFGTDGIEFTSGRQTERITFVSIEAFALGRSNPGLPQGYPGAVAGKPETGSKLQCGAVRPARQMLLARYRDDQGEQQVLVVTVPRKARDLIVRNLEDAGLIVDPGLSTRRLAVQDAKASADGRIDAMC